jgi:regulator of sirC expression with transglutaminase-like and TPR domain
LSATGSLDEKTGEWIGDAQVVEEAKQVCYNTPVMDMLLCVNEVMFNKLKFAGADEDYYYTPQASCIDKVNIAQ